MKIFITTLFIILFSACSTKTTSINPKPSQNEDYYQVLTTFKSSCSSSKVKNLYPKSCKDIQTYKLDKNSAKSFFTNHFKIIDNSNKSGLLTGYYEPLLHGSLKKDEKYKFPLYKRPRDLLKIDIAAIFNELQSKRVRGRLEGKIVYPYYTREEINNLDLDADIICYLDSKIDRFFLEVQGSGRIKLKNGKMIFVGYADQNGHKYSSIGKYLIETGKISKDKISLQSIRKYFNEHPENIDSILNQNRSFVFFKKNSHPAMGALGLTLTAERSIAVDRNYVELGSMLLLSAKGDTKYSKIVFAQDVGGAIKGVNRADMFYGYSDMALQKAGKERSILNLYEIKEIK